MAGMSNEEIINEFDSLFGVAEKHDEEETEVEETEVEGTESENTEGSETDSTEESEQDDSEDKGNSGDADSDNTENKSKPSDKSKSAKQNYAFAEMRQQNKKLNDTVKKLGARLGFDADASIDDILSKVDDIMLSKESEEKGIDPEILRRLDRAEALIAENDRIKLENKVQSDLTDLIEEFNLDDESTQDFISTLIEQGKNPMDGKTQVDFKAEYLKLHWKDMLNDAGKKAVSKEQERKKKVDKHSSSKVPGYASEDSDADKISTVKELDKLFNSMDL